MHYGLFAVMLEKLRQENKLFESNYSLNNLNILQLYLGS